MKGIQCRRKVPRIQQLERRNSMVEEGSCDAVVDATKVDKVGGVVGTKLEVRWQTKLMLRWQLK